MATITAQGFTGTTLQEYLRRIQQEYGNIDAKWDIEPESPDGQQIAIWAETLANLDEIANYAYISRDPATATDQALDDICTYAGVFRSLGTFSTSEVTLTGTTGTLVPAGSRIRNRTTRTLWATTLDRTIAGPVTVPVVALERGALPAAPGDLSQIVQPLAGWQSVTNATAAIEGENRQSDTSLRQERERSVALPGSNQVDNITAAVLAVDAVQRVRVYENPSDAPDARGLKRNSIAIFVQGGDDDDIRAAIAPRKNPGCNMNKNNAIANEVSQDTVTPLGNPLNITFFRPNIIQGYARIVIDSEELAVSEKENIKDAIADFMVNGFGPGTGFTKQGFQIGDSVPAGKLYTPVNNYVGGRGYTVSINVGLFPEDTSALIEAAYNEYVVLTQATIDVVYANELE